MTTINYAIDTGDGNEICSGLPAHTARKTAQEIADQRGESVWLYPILPGDEEPESEEIKPRKQ